MVVAVIGGGPAGAMAAGTVMPVSGEGIYYGMASGRLAAEAVIKDDMVFYEREWNRVYGSQFRLMSLMLRLFYRDDKWRERLVKSLFKHL